jgi:alpha-galactosidase
MQSGLLLLRSALISMSGALVPTFAPLAAAQVALAAPAAQAAATDAQRIVGLIRAAAPAAVAADPDRARDLVVEMRWEGDLAQPVLRNAGAAPVAVKEVVLFDIAHGLAPATPFYGEGLQMLAQTAGTLAAPVDVGDYPDRSHYRLPEPEGFRRVYSLVTLEPASDAQMLVAFTSCSRFVGAFDVSSTRLRAVVDCEGLVIPAGSAWPLEGVLAATGGSRGALLSRLAGEVTKIHPRTAYPAPPAGWCSWYCFGPRVTAKDVLDNLGAMERDYPDLAFVQIDDGYQPTMGDWLDTGPGFGGKPVQDILREIESRGREPAIWVAPFVASPDSKLLRDHPDWFVKGDDGKPMPSDRVMFGGWRLGPWYVLDGTNPAVLAHFERLFATMRREWGVKYFKLDAVFWGMMRGGRLHDPSATRVEAYRAGMRAIRRGAGDDAYILGCNHPIWPSLGLIDGSRSSLDIERNWKSVSRTGRENLLRAWQNGALWWNDPDTLVQTGLPDDEARFHATLVHATGGAMLAGDDLSRLPANRVSVVQALSRPTGVAPAFADLSLSVARIDLGEGRARYAFFNWTDAPVDLRAQLEFPAFARDVWSDQELGKIENAIEVKALAPRSARLIEVHSTVEER